uniref:Secreted RxLR effector peptide protein n=1 Tax=Panagrellus redivivus TaxID=6233 RepID=A0A7E4V3W5_PANRE
MLRTLILVCLLGTLHATSVPVKTANPSAGDLAADPLQTILRHKRSFFDIFEDLDDHDFDRALKAFSSIVPSLVAAG